MRRENTSLCGRRMVAQRHADGLILRRGRSPRRFRFLRPSEASGQAGFSARVRVRFGYFPAVQGVAVQACLQAWYTSSAASWQSCRNTGFWCFDRQMPRIEKSQTQLRSWQKSTFFS